MIRLNMLPDVKREYLRARQLESKVIAIALLLSAGAIAAIVLLSLYTYGAQTLQKSALDSRISKNMKELTSFKDIDKYVTIQNQLANIDTLHSKKSLFSRIFTVLPKLNPKAPHNVKITNLKLDSAASTMIFQGETSSFTGLETFRDTLKNASLVYSSGSGQATSTTKLFSTVSVDTRSLGKSADGATVVSFSITTSYASQLFAVDTKTVDVSVPNKETTQSKTDAPDVFGESTVKQEGTQ